MYERELIRLQAELVKLKEWVRQEQECLVVVFEGRDAAGKEGAIKRMLVEDGITLVTYWFSVSDDPLGAGSYAAPVLWDDDEWASPTSCCLGPLVCPDRPRPRASCRGPVA